MSEKIEIDTTVATVEIISIGTQGPVGAQGIQGPAGEVDPTVINNIQNQVNDVQTLAQTNELKIGTKSDQVDLEAAEQQIELNRLANLTKADISALAQLALLVDTKADQAYVNQQITNLIGNAPAAMDTIYELAAAMQANQGLFDALDQSVANKVRFDVATQALTEIQKQNARTNIGAEALGTAQQLVSQITAASIGAATTAQGAKADTALQSADVAAVALSGLFSSLGSQNGIFNVVFSAYSVGTNVAITATDSLGTMLRNLQAQITALSGFNWVDVTTIAGTSMPSTGAALDLTNTKIYLAKKDGQLWVKGYFKLASDISSPSVGAVFRITDPNWFVDADYNVQVFPASFTLYHPLSITTRCFIQLAASQMDFVVRGNASQASWTYGINPTCIGKAK